MPNGNITLQDDLLREMQEAARMDGQTVDDLATETVKQHLVRLFWQRNKHEAVKRRGPMTDEKVEGVVDSAIHDFRKESLGR
jgi:hypothetical protein